jgi:hypothetical protein
MVLGMVTFLPFKFIQWNYTARECFAQSHLMMIINSELASVWKEANLASSKTSLFSCLQSHDLQYPNQECQPLHHDIRVAHTHSN